MSVDLRLMRYVIAIAEEGSFQRAAQRLHMAQPPLSRQIRDLERHLGVELFLRRPTRLAPAGEVFVAEARQVLAQADHAVARTRAAGRGEIGRVRIGYGPTTAWHEMPTLVTAMRERCPGIEVVTREMWDVELSAALRDGDLDVGLGRHLPVPEGYVTETLRRDRYVVILGDQHPLARRSALRIRDLRGEPFHLFARFLAPDYYDALMDSLTSTGETFETWENPIPGLRNLSLSDGGFMLMPRAVGEHLPSGVVCIPLTDDLPAIDLELLWRPEQAPATRLLVETARTVLSAFSRVG